MSSRVIVVGGGLAGLSAAHTLYERGASVLHLDKNGFHGGNSTKATSGINGAGTRTQGDQGIADSKAIFFEDTKKSARELARDDLIQVLTGRSGEAVDWLEDAFNLKMTKLGRLGGHSQPRTHRGTAQFPGMEITYALMEKLEELAETDPKRMEILKKADVKELIVENGAVVGCKYLLKGEEKIARGPVILATGGYAADFDKDGLLAKHRPDTLPLSTTNGEHCTGDGLKMLMKIGGRPIDLEKVQVHPTGLIDPKEPDSKVKFLAAEALRGAGGILLNGAGERFCDELGHRDYVTGCIFGLPKEKSLVRLILGTEASKDIEWHCKHYTGRGLMKKIEGYKGLSEEMGVPVKKLEEVYAEYAEIAQGKKKDPFGKKFFDNWKTTANDTFYVAQMEPVLHYTMGGIEIDPHSRIINTDGKVIPGVWGAGEIGGGVHGANRLGGSSLLGCVVFGRVAADSAAAYLMNQMSSGAVGSSQAQERLTQVANQLTTKITIKPESQNVTLEFSWAGQDGKPSVTSSSSSSQGNQQDTTPPPSEGDTKMQIPHGTEENLPKKKDLREISLDELAKHNSKDDLWVAVNGQVLDVTSFQNDHPGGAKAIQLYAGKECSEEFNMLHDPKVVAKYASDTIIGTFKQ